MKIEIFSTAGSPLYSGEHDSMSDAVSAAAYAGAVLTEANLSGADLRWADLTGADLTGAKLSGGPSACNAGSGTENL